MSHINLVGALRPKDAAHYLGIGMETLRTSAVPRTYLPGRGVQRRILVYRVVDLDAYLASFQVGRPQLVASSEARQTLTDEGYLDPQGGVIAGQGPVVQPQSSTPGA